DVDKKLSYNENTDTYDLTTDITYNADIEKECYVYDPVPAVMSDDYLYTTQTQRAYNHDSATVSTVDPTPDGQGLKCSAGYYYFEVYGADGGKGGDRTNYSIAGANGGKGGYVSGYFYVPQFMDVSIEVGRAGYIPRQKRPACRREIASYRSIRRRSKVWIRWPFVNWFWAKRERSSP
ncbi:MAG: hypothetical protein II678_04585, partial [Erysipelotrichaceae bacterium]|nr:hypothetical protein [Erysipelotrichaceae bacterium]